MKNVDDLLKFGFISKKYVEEVRLVSSRYPFRSTHYYLSIDKTIDKNGPLAKQVIPSIEELHSYEGMSQDFLQEENYTRAKTVIQKYENRVVLLTTNQCPMFCRHCTRKRFIGQKERRINKRDIQNGIEYIRSRDKIREVILSGGDPLMRGNSYLDNILSSIESIPHIEIIRIDSRVPVTWPSRIGSELLEILANRNIPIWFLTQFNHPKEITEISKEVCFLLQKKGIPILNQNVILKGVNNKFLILKSLFEKLTTIKVKPYYLYQCDHVEGVGHFVDSLTNSMGLMKELQNSTSGIALPILVVDGKRKRRYIHNEVEEKNENSINL